MKLFLQKMSFGLLVFLLVGSIHAQSKDVDADLQGTWVLDHISITQQNNGRSIDQDVSILKDDPIFFTSEKIVFEKDVLSFTYHDTDASSHYVLDTDKKEFMMNETPVPFLLSYILDNGELYLDQQLSDLSLPNGIVGDFHVSLTYKKQE